MAEQTVATTSGRVRGRKIDGVERYLGVPYAEAPVGDRRFQAPVPRAAMDGVFDATEKGPSAPYQLGDFPALDLVPLVGAGWDRGDDYLNINIWTPDSAAEGAPVMVFIHGGAWTGGAAMAPVQDGTSFARHGVVLMSIGYRLGIEGFLPIEGAPTNLGLRDMICALEWVRANAAAFGGDPGNVTIFGESAGAMSVADLMAAPAAKGLFRRAIVQSGHGSMTRTRGINEKVTRKVARYLGVAPTVEGFRTTTIEQGLDALAKVQLPKSGLDLRDGSGREPAYGLSRFLPIHGDDVLPVQPLEAVAAGASADVDLLIGSNLEEMNLYFVPTGVKRKAGRLLSWFVLSRSIRKAGAILRATGRFAHQAVGVVIGQLDRRRSAEQATGTDETSGGLCRPAYVRGAGRGRGGAVSPPRTCFRPCRNPNQPEAFHQSSWLGVSSWRVRNPGAAPGPLSFVSSQVWWRCWACRWSSAAGI